MDEKNHDIVELKKTVKIKVCTHLPCKCTCFHGYVHQAQELSEAAVKIGLLEKKVENAGSEV